MQEQLRNPRNYAAGAAAGAAVYTGAAGYMADMVGAMPASFALGLMSQGIVEAIYDGDYSLNGYWARSTSPGAMIAAAGVVAGTQFGSSQFFSQQAARFGAQGPMALAAGVGATVALANMVGKAGARAMMM